MGNNNNDQPRILLAVILSGAILLGWNYFFSPKAPSQPAARDPVENSPISGTSSSRRHGQDSPASSNPSPISSGNESLLEEVKVYLVSREGNSFELDSTFSLLNAKTRFSKADFRFVTGIHSPSEASFELLIPHPRLGHYKKPFFRFEKKSNSKLFGIDSELGVTAEVDILESGKLHVHLGFQTPVKPRFVFRSKEFDPDKEGGGGGGSSFFGVSSSYKSIRRFLFLSEDLEEVLVQDEESGDVQTQWLGIDSAYHLFAFTFPEKISLHYLSRPDGQLWVDFNREISVLEGNFIYAKKNYDDLKSLGENLHLGVDFGFFAVVAVPLFKALQFIHSVIPNWGIAIILLTILIRLMTFPLYYKQMKSMNKMKKIQPKLKKLKEKYKGDTKRQQMETMQLFKTEGVNPMGGCFPLLLQMPIFLAFYKVLTVSAELDNQPFVGWVTSLTEKDPYYVLPILVTFLMWLNQKIMPQTSMDPTQQKVMGFMPLIFGFIFLNMPSGLNLYIFISTGFGILQQIFVNRRMETH